jgi:hypothetical protein
LTPVRSLRYLQGLASGDGWIYPRLNRFKIFVYDAEFADTIRAILHAVKSEFRLTDGESRRIDRFTGTREWFFELGGENAMRGLHLGLLKSAEGSYFLAGLWDADGGWYAPNESHPFGQARIFGKAHVVRVVKHLMKNQWMIATGRMSIVTNAGHTSRTGSHTIVTRANVYGTTVRTRSMDRWIELVGSMMLLKGGPEISGRADFGHQEKSFTP